MFKRLLFHKKIELERLANTNYNYVASNGDTVRISKSNDRCKYVVCQHYEYQNLMIDVSMSYVNTVRISKSNDRCKYVVCQHCTNIKIQ